MTHPLRRILDNRGLRSNAIAAKLNLSATSFQRWIQIGIPEHRVTDVANAIGVTAEDLNGCVHVGARRGRPANGASSDWLKALVAALPPDQAQKHVTDFIEACLRGDPGGAQNLIANNVRVVAVALAKHFLKGEDGHT